MASRKKRRSVGFLEQHGLSAAVAGILLVLLGLFATADPETHLGAFYSNAVADWLGTLVFVIATKYLFEIGSAESRRPHPSGRAMRRFLVDHSLTIALVITGAMWAVAYARLDPTDEPGQVVGSIVSEWTQVLGLVVMTKYLGEAGSKEGG
jgi:hypothetical protein